MHQPPSHAHARPLSLRPLLQTRRRTALCTGRGIGYLIQYLDTVVVTANFSSGIVSINSPFYTSKQRSDFSSREYYASLHAEIEQRDLVGLSLDTNRRSELVHLAGEPVAADDSMCIFVTLNIKGDPHKTCLRLLTQTELQILQPHFDTIVPIAEVSYTLAESNFKHYINLLQINASAIETLAPEFVDSLSNGAEWIVPRKVENGYSLNFHRHTQNIARSLVFEILEHEAAKELYRMEQVQTNQLIIRFQERSSVSEGISLSKRRRVEAREECEAAARFVRSVFRDASAHLTNSEAGEFHGIQRKILDEIYDAEGTFSTESKQFEERSRKRLEYLSRRTKLIETPENSWVFETLDPKLTGQMSTSSLRHALISLETHSTLSSVNESLMRQGKELRSVPYIQL